MKSNSSNSVVGSQFSVVYFSNYCCVLIWFNKRKYSGLNKYLNTIENNIEVTVWIYMLLWTSGGVYKRIQVNECRNCYLKSIIIKLLMGKY